MLTNLEEFPYTINHEKREITRRLPSGNVNVLPKGPISTKSLKWILWYLGHEFSEGRIYGKKARFKSQEDFIKTI